MRRTDSSLDWLSLAVSWLREHYPSCSAGLVDPADDYWKPFLPYAQRVLSMYQSKIEGNKEQFVATLQSVAEMSFDFLARQARFMKSGKYSAEDPAVVANDLYLSQERMQDYYLDALFMTYALWPNHLKMYQFLCDRFAYGPYANVLEIGVGHGLAAATILENNPACQYLGLDISPFSLTYAQDLLRRVLPECSSFELARFDAQQSRDWRSLVVRNQPLDAIVCGEVLEHITNPDELLREAHKLLHPLHGRMCVTTVANIEAEDHVYLFETLEEIHNLFAKTGFVVEEESVFDLGEQAIKGHRPFNYIAILVPSAEP